MTSGGDRLVNWRSLRDRRDFARIYGEGAKRVGRLLVLYLLPAEDNAKAVVASRKVGGAVQRNRARRLLRAGLMASRLRDAAGAADARDATFPLPDGRTGLWVVAVARTRIMAASYREVAGEIDRLLDPTALTT